MGRSAFLAAAAAAALACGGSDAPQPSGTPMTPDAAPTASARAGNRAPRVESVRFEPEAPGAGEPLRAVVEATDPDGDPIRLGFAWTLGSSPADANGALVKLDGVERGDRIELRATPSNGVAEGEPFYAAVSVANRPPRLDGLVVDPAGRISARSEVTARPMARDPDGDGVSFEYTWWVNGETVEEQGPALATGSLRRGDHIRVRVVAQDGFDASEPLESPEIEVTNSAPAIVSQPQPTDASGVFRYRVVAEDADGDRTLRYALEVAPEGMDVTPASGEIAWTPRPDQTGTHPVVVSVDDLQGGRTLQSFDVIVGEVEQPPAEQQPPAASGS